MILVSRFHSQIASFAASVAMRNRSSLFASRRSFSTNWAFAADKSIAVRRRCSLARFSRSMMPLNRTPSERESDLHDQMTARIVNEESVARFNEEVVGNRDAQNRCDNAGAGNRRIARQ